MLNSLTRRYGERDVRSPRSNCAQRGRKMPVLLPISIIIWQIQQTDAVDVDMRCAASHPPAASSLSLSLTLSLPVTCPQRHTEPIVPSSWAARQCGTSTPVTLTYNGIRWAISRGGYCREPQLARQLPLQQRHGGISSAHYRRSRLFHLGTVIRISIAAHTNTAAAAAFLISQKCSARLGGMMRRHLILPGGRHAWPVDVRVARKPETVGGLRHGLAENQHRLLLLHWRSDLLELPAPSVPRALMLPRTASTPHPLYSVLGVARRDCAPQFLRARARVCSMCSGCGCRIDQASRRLCCTTTARR